MLQLKTIHLKKVLLSCVIIGKYTYSSQNEMNYIQSMISATEIYLIWNKLDQYKLTSSDISKKIPSPKSSGAYFINMVWW